MQSDVNQRRAQRKKQIRKRRIKVTFIFFLIVSLIALAIMCFTVFFKIKEIEISGSNIYLDRQEELIDASGLKGKNLFVVSEDKVEAKIRNKLPYVDDVTIKRKFPNKIILTVIDATEKMYFENDGNYYLISENGYILSVKQEKSENAFEVVTSGISGKVGWRAEYQNSTEKTQVEKIVTTLDKYGIHINKIDVTDPVNITIEVENRFTVTLGRDEYIEEKIAHLNGMIESIGNRSGKINLSMWTPEKSQGSFIENKS